jgi:hypothetical protein
MLPQVKDNRHTPPCPAFIELGSSNIMPMGSAVEKTTSSTKVAGKSRN